MENIIFLLAISQMVLESVMLRRTMLIGLLAATTLLQGCLPALIVDSNERKSFAELNLEREKAGLQPLTWEQYHNHGLHTSGGLVPTAN